MRWFFAINEQASGFDDYADLLRVAVHTAQAHTTLAPVCVYDGHRGPLASWLRERGVTVIPRRSFLYDDLARIAERRGDPNYLAIGAGAFLRLEIPALALEQGWDDAYVLYTDVDVMFLRDVASPLAAMHPRFFAVAPESDPSDYHVMNSGVMLMHLPALREQDPAFRTFTRRRLERLVDQAWDQGAYVRYYGRTGMPHRAFRAIQRLVPPRWDRLPPEFNWKPHWGPNPDACIVHFHGPKPPQAASLRSSDLPRHLHRVRDLMRGGFDEFSARWAEALREARA